MLFPTATFTIFFLVVLPLSWLLMPRGERWRPFIIAASYVFYSAWDWRFVFLLAASTLWNQLFALSIHRRADENARKIEAHLIDFPERDLYGDRLSVDLLARIRETRPFPSVDALRTQLTDDVRRAAEIAAALP